MLVVVSLRKPTTDTYLWGRPDSGCLPRARYRHLTRPSSSCEGRLRQTNYDHERRPEHTDICHHGIPDVMGFTVHHIIVQYRYRDNSTCILRFSGRLSVQTCACVHAHGKRNALGHGRVRPGYTVHVLICT